MAEKVELSVLREAVVGDSSEVVNNNNKYTVKDAGLSEWRGRSYSADAGRKNFPPRQKVDISFQDVRYSVREWSLKKPIPVKKEILHGVSGKFCAGELTAIMGPSGAGKSTLLNVLAAFTIRGSSGSVKVNNKERKSRDPQEFKAISCYIQQDDYVRPELTVSEAMHYASDLKLGFNPSRKDKTEQIEHLLDMLGLLSVMNTQTDSLSGGQRKRLSIALELINNPPVIFLDEPTTGLDSSSCSQCVGLLKQLAQQGRTVICTIHQPSALLFEMFDQLYALALGNCIYSGRVDRLVPYLADVANLVCPEYHNPADYLLDIASGEYGADINLLAAAESNNKHIKERESLDAAILRDTPDKTTLGRLHNAEDPGLLATVMPSRAPLLAQMWLLFIRKLLMIRRSPGNVLVRAGAHLFIAALFGYLYGGVGAGASTVLANYCYLYGSVLFLVYTGKMAVTLMFPMELNTVMREHFNGWYNLGPYYISMMFVEMPFQILCSYLYLPLSFYLTGQPMEWHRFWHYSIAVTAASLTAQGFGFLLGVTTPRKIAVFLGPSIACLLSVFGFCLRFGDTPVEFRWLYYISYFRAAFQSSVYSMYGLNRGNLYCDPEEYCHFKSPKKFLSEMDLPEADISYNLNFIVVWGVILHILTVAVVWFRLNKK